VSNHIRTPVEMTVNENEPVETSFSFDIVSNSRPKDVLLYDFIEAIIREFSSDNTNLQPVTFSNDIPPSVLVTTDEDRLKAVVKGMLRLIINTCTSRRIRVSAKAYSNLVLLSVKDHAPKEKEIDRKEFDYLQRLAAKIGGCVTVNDVNGYCGSLTLTIFDLAAAA
jgi:hypothetical protein